MLRSSQCVLVKHDKGNRLLVEKREQRRREGHATGQFGIGSITQECLTYIKCKLVEVLEFVWRFLCH